MYMDSHLTIHEYHPPLHNQGRCVWFGRFNLQYTQKLNAVQSLPPARQLYFSL